MQRDLLSLPHDDNGDALWHAVQNGLTLGEAHRVRFSVAFRAYVNAFQSAVFCFGKGVGCRSTKQTATRATRSCWTWAST
jgi:hypothetical protein